ncbi:MAG TPA: glutamate--tRNA ligase family protein, partial [Gemmataceae bacterium]|nr:glutamate--tRNA ligase family protein [Gemmataceae bacterium]
LDWDEGPVVQTQRLEAYRAALHRLQGRELVYPCTCTRGDVERAASAPHWDHEGPAYPGTCAARRAADAEALQGRPFAWRFRVPPESPAFDDLFRGPTHVDLRRVGGDFVVWKSAGAPAYQLAVVVDDAAAGVTQVVRGDDLVPSTPRQLLLYEALGWAPPRYAHVPLVVGPDGRRLAKRHGDTRLSALRAAGVRPEALLGLLAWSCGWLAKAEPVTARELLPAFRMGSIPPTPFVLTPQRLGAIGYS